MSDTSALVDYLFEVGQLKRVKRSGWWLVNHDSPESVAEHSHRATVISYLLGLLEGADAQRCAMITLFHDIHETRLLDLHKVAQRYVDNKGAEERVEKDQISELPTMIKDMIAPFTHAKEESVEKTIAKDADLLECAFTAKEYLDNGHTLCDDWIINIETALRTESAKKLLVGLKETHSQSWWEGLKKTIMEEENGKK